MLQWIWKCARFREKSSQAAGRSSVENEKLKKEKALAFSFFEIHLQIGEAHAAAPDLTRYPFATYLIKLVKHTPPHL